MRKTAAGCHSRVTTRSGVVAPGAGFAASGQGEPLWELA